MNLIGNAHDAALALSGTLDMFSEDGTTRNVYLINGVIYKVESTIRYTANADEFSFAEMVRDELPAGIAIPNMTMWGDVLACEFINGEATGECIDVSFLGLPCSHDMTCIDPVVMISLEPFFRDPSWGNAIRSNGIIYLVDVA